MKNNPFGSVHPGGWKGEVGGDKESGGHLIICLMGMELN